MHTIAGPEKISDSSRAHLRFTGPGDSGASAALGEEEISFCGLLFLAISKGFAAFGKVYRVVFPMVQQAGPVRE